MLLPWFSGPSSIWSIRMVFFQVERVNPAVDLDSSGDAASAAWTDAFSNLLSVLK